MSSQSDSIATPVVRGLLGALGSLGTAVAVVVVPALAAQVAASQSSATVLDAIIIALNVLILGHGGGIVLSTGVVDGPVTLTPLGLLILLILLSAGTMRRMGRKLAPVGADGQLRPGALRDLGAALTAYGIAYAIGMAVLAGIGRSADTSPLIASAVVSGAMVAVVGGVLGLLWSLRREATDRMPAVEVLALLPAPYGAVARAALIAVAGLLALGLAALLVMMLVAIPQQSALFDQLAPGPVGGIVLTLLQLALLPLLVVWALAILLGGKVGVGAGSELSLDGSATGVMPALPMLAALPEPGDFAPWAWGLVLLPLLPVVLGAVRLARDTESLERREMLTAWIAYPVTVVIAVLLVSGLGTGGIGEDRLLHLGPRMGSLLLPLLGIAVLGTAGVHLVLCSPLIPRLREGVDLLREKVERAEQQERAEGAGDDQPDQAAQVSGDHDDTAQAGEQADDGAAGPGSVSAADAADRDPEAQIGVGDADAGTADAEIEAPDGARGADEDAPDEARGEQQDASDGARDDRP